MVDQAKKRVDVQLTKAKDEFDVKIVRDRTEVTWTAPADAIAIKVTMLGSFGHLNPMLEYSKDHRTCRLPVSAHQWAPTPPGMPGVVIEYRLDVQYAATPVGIDPYLIIQP
jgi:hypothetical protein